MDALRDCLIRAFNGYTTNRGYCNNHSYLDITDSINMVIPIFKNSFEVPVLILSDFNYFLAKKEYSYDVIVANLYFNSYQSSYASIDSSIRSTINKNFNTYRLIKVNSKTVPNKHYFVTNGAIFDSNLNPVMIMSWQIDNVSIDAQNPDYKYIRPITRIKHEVFKKEDDIQRYICNKFFTETVKLNSILDPLDNNLFNSVKIEIDNPSFILQRPSIPSVNTTKQQLLNTVINHLDEIPMT